MDNGKMTLTNLIKGLLKKKKSAITGDLEPRDPVPEKAGDVSNRDRELVTLWEGLAAKAEKRNLGPLSVKSLAKATGLKWYRARGDEIMGKFLPLRGSEILAVPTFGREKIKRLCDILERVLELDFQANLGVEKTPLTLIALRETLAEWEVPLDFPCYLIELPVRIQGYCEGSEIKCIAGLLDTWDRLGSVGLINQPNLGRKSVGALEDFIDSLSTKNRGKAAGFLPLSTEPGETGLSVIAGLRFAVQELNSSELSLMKRRLVAGMTLEESATEGGPTRERVRQIEMNFLNKISSVLDFFDDDREDLLTRWLRDEEILPVISRAFDDGEHELLESALVAIFENSPRGIARKMEKENLLDSTLSALKRHEDFWFGGVELEEFIEETLKSEDRGIFCEFLMTCSQVRVNHQKGRVLPARTNLAAVVKGLLESEDDAIPLTWLIQLVGETPYHPGVERNDLTRRRYSWQRSANFPDDKIIWEQ